MADNYLEKRYDEIFGSGAVKKAPHAHKTPSLDSLMLKNRSVRGFDQSRVVSMDELKSIIEVNTRIASSKNWQILRFKPVVAGSEADIVNANIKMGALFRKKRLNAAPGEDLENFPDLPLGGTQPQAFIVICSLEKENPSVLIDLGISLQSMSLKAVEMGLNCLMIRAIDRAKLSASLDLGGLEPIAVLAVGKSAEKIFLLPASEGDDLSYFRRDGIHYVPKLRLEDILLK